MRRRIQTTVVKRNRIYYCYPTRRYYIFGGQFVTSSHLYDAKAHGLQLLIGYTDHDPAEPPPPAATGWSAWLAERAAALATNDVFAPLFGLYNGMDAHEAHLAREMKLAGQATVVDPNPYLSRMDGANGVDYAAIVLCPGRIQ